MKKAAIAYGYYGLLLSLLGFSEAWTFDSAAFQEGAQTLPDAWAFGRRAAIANASLSDDGKHIVAVTLPDSERTTV